MFLLGPIFGLCFNLSHGKKFAPTSAQKYVQPWALCFTHCPWGLSALTWLLGSKERRKVNERLVLRWETQENNFLKVFYLVRGHRKKFTHAVAEGVIKNICKRTRVRRCIKLQNFGRTYFMDVHLIIFQKRIFEVMKFLLVVTEFWTVEP